jgi:hypothetical protein
MELALGFILGLAVAFGIMLLVGFNVVFRAD